MGLLDTLLSNPGALEHLAKTAGLDAESARRGVQALLPAVSQGVRRNAQEPAGLAGLLGALSAGNHEQLLDRPDKLGDPRVREQGNAVLGEIFGSKEVSRNVAARASEETGLGTGPLKQLLPLVASMVAGSLGRSGIASQLGGGVAPAASSGRAGDGAIGMLEQFLDADGDGQVLDDVFGMAKKFF